MNMNTRLQDYIEHIKLVWFGKKKGCAFCVYAQDTTL